MDNSGENIQVDIGAKKGYYHCGTNFLSFQKTSEAVFDAPLLRLFCEGFVVCLLLKSLLLQ